MIASDTHGRPDLLVHRQPPFEAARWREMAPSEAKALLRLGGCMVDQFVEDGQGELAWGRGFQFGSSPLTQLALARDLPAVAEAIALGACPFTRDMGGDGVFDVASSMLLDPDAAVREQGARMAALAWDAGALLLDPDSPGKLPARGADWIRFHLASKAYSDGSARRMREAGVPIRAEWIAPFQHEVEFVRQTMLGWTGGGIDALRELRDGGLDFISPIAVGSIRESLWMWLDDTDENARELAQFLLESGNDPREPLPDGSIPLELVRVGCPDLAGFVDALFLAQREREELSREAAPAKTAKPAGL